MAGGLVLITLIGLNSQAIEVNPDHIVSIRTPGQQTPLTRGVRCIIHTSDGKVISLAEECESVRHKLRAAMDGRNSR